MRCQLITPTVLEPITLAELKLHLRLDSGSFAENIDETSLILPGSHGVADNFTTHVGVLVLTGSIDPAASTAVVGVGTLFTTELVVGDRITVTGETRTVTAIADDTNLTVSVAFPNNANDPSPDRLTKVEVLGYTAVVVLVAGTNGATGTVAVKIQESDDNVTYTDWGTNPTNSVSFLTITTAACVGADGTYALTFTGANTTPATGTYTILTNVITAVALTSGGTGYSTAPTVTNPIAVGGVITASIGAFVQVTTTNDNATYEKAYTGTKRYIRTVAKVLLEACEFGTSVIRLAATTYEDDILNALITTAREHVEDTTGRALLTQTWDYSIGNWPPVDFIKLPFGNLQSVTSIKWKDTDGLETNLTKTLEAFAASSVSPATKTKVTSTAHGFDDGDIVSIDGTTSYDGSWTISNVGTNTFDITMVFVADDATGTATEDYLVETNGEQCGRIVLPYDDSWPTDTLYPSNPITIRFICGWTTRALVPYKIKAAMKMICAKLYESRGEDVIGHIVKEYDVVGRLLGSATLWDEF